MRSFVRHQIETLERWLRRLIDDVLKAHHSGTLSGTADQAGHQDQSG
jgi:hypothetical protein